SSMLQGYPQLQSLRDQLPNTLPLSGMSAGHAITDYSVDPEHVEAMRVAFRWVCGVLQLHCTADDPITTSLPQRSWNLRTQANTTLRDYVTDARQRAHTLREQVSRRLSSFADAADR